MRKKVEYYKGTEITDEVLKRVNLIELKRQREGLTTFTSENIDSLEELCYEHDTKPAQENIILGEDWYIIYTTFNKEIEIQEWLSIGNVKDKLIQTMEMFNAIKTILLDNKDKSIYATLRHSTSYKFYKLLLEKGYIKEFENRFDIADDIPEDLLTIIENIPKKYNSIEEYIDTEKEDNLEDLPDFIYHNVDFKVSDKFIERYNKR